MRITTRWLRRPQQVWLRRALFQIHLWLGLAVGLYVVVLSVSGSVLVYRIELNQYVSAPRATLRQDVTPMTADQIRDAAARAYPGWTVTGVFEGRYTARGGSGEYRGPRQPPDPTASVDLVRGGEKKDRLFDPYTGADLGDNFTRGQSAVLWLVNLHDELLLGRLDGGWWNGALSLVFTLVVLTGFVVWWPGLTRWTRSLRISATSGWRRFNWDVHSALGFWLLLFMLMWGVSGWYLGIPEPLTVFVERYSDPDGVPGERPGDIALTWLARLHFGRWRDPGWGPWLKAVWAAVGLAPAVMFVTGTIMWWNRVVRRRLAGRTPAVEYP
jgi:uncharacterized iron-regulated membrane protein